MGYREIPLAAIAVGKVTSQLLWFMVRNNFRTHESRILDLETDTAVLPPGFMLEYAGTSAPTGFLICDGSAVSQATYADLFAVVGLSYGNPGGGNFNLPDFRSKSPLGKGTGASPTLTARSLAATGGAETHTLTQAEMGTHSHDETDPGHLHTNVGKGTGVGTATKQHNTLFGVAATPTGPTVAANTGIVINSEGGGGSHNNMHPHLTLNFIIKT